jgi:hypothetical protein
MNEMLNAEAGNMEQLPADSSVERAEIQARPIHAQAQARNTVANGLSTDAEEEERTRERASKREIFFVRESVLRRLNRIPRRGSDQSFRDPVTGLPNDNVHEPLEKFDGSKTCFVFISHLWLRPGAGPAAHPDNVDHQMCKLILSAFSRLRGPHSAPVPEDFEFAVWIDFSCFDQDTLGATFASVRHKLEREREREYRVRTPWGLSRGPQRVP